MNGPYVYNDWDSFYNANEIHIINVGMYCISSIHVTHKLNVRFCLLLRLCSRHQKKEMLCLQLSMIAQGTKLATQSKERKKVQAINANG